MFKEITAISKNFAWIKMEGTTTDDLLNMNVVFEENEKKILGEVDEIDNGQIKVSFLGEFINGKFQGGIIRKPSLTANVRIINQNELGELVGNNNKKGMILGLSPLYGNCPIKIDIDDMWSNHNAFFGNTGSGKTYGVSRFVQNLFNMSDKIPFNSNIFIFNNTDELNLNVDVPGIGYTRQFRKCFEIDSKGEFSERILIAEYIQQFVDNTTKWNEDYVPIYFTLDDLEVALNFALISEGLLLNEKTSSEAMALKVKLHTINNSSYKNLFNCDKFCTSSEFITNIIMVGSNKRAQIINFVLEDIDDRFAKAIVKVYCRIIFKFSKGLRDRGAMPIHLMLEEAHRYVQKDYDVEILGYNIFERIAKEGRKFGVIMDLITQRPTELSETVISQCTNFLIFKITHPSDLDYIKKMVPNISNDVIEKQKTLQAGTCVAFGKMMKIPMIVKMQLPNPEPHSSNASIYDKWMIEINK